jgi:hypothetical protein
MAYNQPRYDKPQVVRKTKVETTYEYVPILGEILGYWRKQSQMRLGEDIELHLNHSLREYDRIFVNGEELKLPPLTTP